MRTRPLLALLSAAVVAASGTASAAGSAPLPTASTTVSTAAVSPQPLERAHAHNDYEHDRPLVDALRRGFTSVEADVYLVGDDLLVAHDPQDVQPGRDLRALDLDPLRARVRAQGGAVHRGYRGVFQLLVDVKTDPVATYAALDRLLAEYRDVLWRWEDGRPVRRAVQVVVSGNRALPVMAAQPVRYAGYDSRLVEAGRVPTSLSPLLSDSWTATFSWRGEGPMPAAERRELRRIVAQAHARGQRVRFYATPDTVPGRGPVWRELVAAGADHLNTDHLDALRRWLLAHDPAEQQPAA